MKQSTNLVGKLESTCGKGTRALRNGGRCAPSNMGELPHWTLRLAI